MDIAMMGTSYSRRSLIQRIAMGLALPVLADVVPWTAARAEERSEANSPHFANRLASYICSARFEDLHPAAVNCAKEQLIYHVGLAFSGALTASGRQAVSTARMLNPCSGPCTMIGQPIKVAPLEAAFANASFMRALGLDDVLFPSATHAGLLVFPVALAIAEQQHSSGAELLAAIITGYEVLGKLVVDEAEGRTPRRPSMPFGAFAGAAVAARLMRLTPEQTANAIGYAADSVMGLKEGNEQQPTHVYGWINRNAMTSAILARGGGETAPTILEGTYGFYATVIGRLPDVDAVIQSLGKDPEIKRATQKRYPGTAMNIVPIQLLLQMVTTHHLSVDNVAHVEFELPLDRKTFEDSISKGPFPSRTQAESSLAFQTAIILLDGKIDFMRYEHRNDPEILAIAQRIDFALAPHSNTRYARIRLTTFDGRAFVAEGQDYVFPPLDRTAWLARDGETFLSIDNLDRFAKQVDRLETVTDVGQLMALLTPQSH